MTNSKQKGKNGELELSKFLRDHGFPEAKRGQQYCESDSVSLDLESEKIISTFLFNGA